MVTSALFYSHVQLIDIADVFAISGPVGVGTQVGMTVIGQRQARDHTKWPKLRDGSFAICLSPQMTAN